MQSEKEILVQEMHIKIYWAIMGFVKKMAQWNSYLTWWH